tara:strand:+ start:1114 stop:1323 length:210 start_codon:yes stop_codon:yes gene_type:complete
MKQLLEIWRTTLREEEQEGEDKAKVLANAHREVEGLVKKVQSAAAGDDGLAREVLESMITGLQQAVEEL